MSAKRPELFRASGRFFACKRSGLNDSASRIIHFVYVFSVPKLAGTAAFVQNQSPAACARILAGLTVFDVL